MSMFPTAMVRRGPGTAGIGPVRMRTGASAASAADGAAASPASSAAAPRRLIELMFGKGTLLSTEGRPSVRIHRGLRGRRLSGLGARLRGGGRRVAIVLARPGERGRLDADALQHAPARDDTGVLGLGGGRRYRGIVEGRRP